MIHKEFRNDINWYLQLNWKLWYSKRHHGWYKEIRKTDVLMSAMFKASRKKLIKTSRLIDVVGNPDYIVGTTYNGIIIYKMFRRIDMDPLHRYVYFDSIKGVIQKCGTSHLRHLNGMNFCKK